jgi:hypothetical protein
MARLLNRPSVEQSAANAFQKCLKLRIRANVICSTGRGSVKSRGTCEHDAIERLRLNWQLKLINSG